MVDKFLDEVNPRDLIQDNGTAKLHLFSNILDMPTWDHTSYFKSLFDTGGKQSYLCVSPYREFDGGQERFRDVLNLFNDNSTKDGRKIKMNDLSKFAFRDNKDAISLKLEAIS